MWAKITGALKPSQAAKELPLPPPKDLSAQGEVMNKVFEQHPNMSVFHTNETGIVDRSPSPPPSPSVHNKKNMFKRMSRAPMKEDSDGNRGGSLFAQPSTISKKGNGLNATNMNGSQATLQSQPSSQRDMGRRSSFDMLKPSPPRADTTRSVKDSHRRPSIDFLRQETAQGSPGSPGSPNFSQQWPVPPRGSSLDALRLPSEAQNTQDANQFWAEHNQANDNDLLSTPAGIDKFGSKRSILRDRNTPGTGQNVRFIGRDAYKVITPDQSLSTELQSKPQPALPKDETPFMERLTQDGPSDSPQSLERSQSASSAKSSRPTVAEIFAPLLLNDEIPPPAFDQTQSDVSMSSFNHFVVEDNSNIFNVSQHLDMPAFPPGLEFDVNAPMFENFDNSGNENILEEGGLATYSEHKTSTPYRPSDSKGKEKEVTSEDPIPSSVPQVIDETIFHSKEKSPKLPAPLHERSQSFSLGQTLFYSMGNAAGNASKPSETSAAYPSSELKPESLNSSPAAPTPPSVKSRSRAMSDTVFQTMLRSSSSPAKSAEADINDESSAGLVVYSGGPAEPDPFSANANTYYTPQTMIPMTPPKGSQHHTRKTSKEESIIMSLQTQLALRTELCAQYEADLKARDELVELLGRQIADAEKEEAKRKTALRSWKRKVQELERACRQLEEAVEDSRQMSMERSVMDEASSEALRMLHRQIASLERERGDWTKREMALQGEVETLEGLVRERTEDVQQLKESLWSRDESERELKEGIWEAKEQIDMMGNISVGAIDEEELKKILMEKDQKTAEETQRFRTAEFALKQELADVKMKCEGLEVQKASWEEQLENVNQNLKTREEEYAILKSELEAQWQHTEHAGDKFEALEREKVELASERDEIKAALEDLEARTATMEQEWAENEKKFSELDGELQEVWTYKEALEKERGELEDELHHERERVQDLESHIEERDQRIAGLEQEYQFAQDNVARLQENLKQRDAEIQQHIQRVVAAENEAERLHEEMSTLKREYQRHLSEQTRALEDATGQRDQTQEQMDKIVRDKAAVDIELKAWKERATILMEDAERMRRQNHSLLQESADKEMKITQANKQHAQDKEDIYGLNVALDSKQQELELIKRKMGVRGTAGSTPAPASKVAQHRRDSSIFSATPLSGPASRPPSALSQTDTESISVGPLKERKISGETGQSVSARVTALGKSTRVNTLGGPVASAIKPSTSGRASVDSSMGPPALKPRPSIATPTPTGRVSSLTRSFSANKIVTPQSVTPMPHRRGSSAEQNTPSQRAKVSRPSVAASPAPSSVAEVDEKENMGSPVKKRTMIPVPA